MLIAIWRCLLLLLAAAAIAFSAFDLVGPLNEGDFGMRLAPVHGQAATYRVTSATDTAAAAGLRAGDTVELAVGDVFRCTRLTRAGERCSFKVTHEGHTRQVELTAATVAVPVWVRLLQGVLRLSFLGLGGVVAWRWFENSAARALATLLVAFGVTMTLGDVFLRMSWSDAVPVIPLLQLFSLVVGSAAAVYFATLFLMRPRAMCAPRFGGLRCRLPWLQPQPLCQVHHVWSRTTSSSPVLSTLHSQPSLASEFPMGARDNPTGRECAGYWQALR